MNVLVAVASRHGSTREIAAEIAEELRDAGLCSEVLDIPNTVECADFDAIVLGSAVYMGGWLSVACKWAERHRSQLAGKPVWLFSSGPLGDDPKPAGDPNGIAAIIATTGAREHRVFAGRLELDELGVAERLITRVVRAPDGDFRDWPAIHAWAREIADALVSVQAYAPP